MATPVARCAVCGQVRVGGENWFLMTESCWQDKITILQWHDQVALQPGVQSVCGASHAQELVVHWMTMGSLDYPFAVPRSIPGRRKRGALQLTTPAIDLRGTRPIGELAIHRESIQRILRESPHSLTAILDALLGALERNQTSIETLPKLPESEICAVGPEWG